MSEVISARSPQKLVRVVVAIVVAAVAFMSAGDVAPAGATAYTAYLYNTPLSTNLGLQFCTVSSAHACIDSLEVNGVPVTQTMTPSTSDFTIGGGVYFTMCRYVETTAASCEVPYVAVSSRMLSPENPVVPMSNVTLRMRRPGGTDATDALGATVVNGRLQSFEPASPGVRDVSTVVAEPREIQGGSTGMCVGWVVAIDGCTVAEDATSIRTNSVHFLLLPGMRTSLVPPDLTDPNCDPGMNVSACVVNVFDSTSIGGWTDTDASIFGLASTDRLTGAAQLKIAGPHWKQIPYDTVTTANPCPYIASICAGQPAGTWGYTYTTVPRSTAKELNSAYFRMFLPTEFLRLSFGLRPSQANITTLPVKRTLNGASPMQSTVYTPSATGLLIDTSGITFSMPNMNVSRVLVVRQNRRVSTSSIVSAAGLSLSKSMYRAPIITVAKSKGMKKVGTGYVFTKRTGSLTVTITYRSDAITRATRNLIVKVVK